MPSSAGPVDPVGWRWARQRRRSRSGAVQNLAGSRSPRARCGRREGDDLPARWRWLGSAPGLADDEQARVLPAAERAGESAAIQVDCGQHLTTLAHTNTVLVADVGVPDGALGIHADSCRVVCGRL